MISSDNRNVDGRMSCISCQRKEREILELHDEYSYAYILHEDDIVRVEQLETALSKAPTKTENDTDQNRSKQNGRRNQR